MDDLISAVFGDDSIFLSCNSGECLHYTMVPGFEVRHHHDYIMQLVLLIKCLLINSVVKDRSIGS